MNRIEEIIEKSGFYCAPVHGMSMYPLLKNHRDSVYITKPEGLKKYDVILFRRSNNQLVLHRILKLTGDTAVMCGDNEYKKEIIEQKQIIGKMTEFCRNGKVIKISNLWYRVYTHCFCFSFKTKRLLMYAYGFFTK